MDGEGAERARAQVLTELVGSVAVGDAVICNTTAVVRSLGTGGWHLVHWNLSRTSLDLRGPEHIMKMRYTSLQADVGSVELDHPAAVDRPLEDMAVVVCGLHSLAAVVLAGLRVRLPGARLAYVMTDGAALPLALSDLMWNLQTNAIVDATITAGHAFGGDLEAVTVAAALGAARHVVAADVAVVAMGPGVVGTGSELGTTAIEVGPILDLVATRGGQGVLGVRAGTADTRERHRGVSHHIHTALELTHSRPFCATLGTDLGADAQRMDPFVRWFEPSVVPTVDETMDRAGTRITTMGRGPDADPLFFEMGCRAAAVAADLSGA